MCSLALSGASRRPADAVTLCEGRTTSAVDARDALGGMARPAMRTRKSAIAEYWLGTREGRARLPGNAALIDLGEPSCFACGWMAADPDA